MSKGKIKKIKNLYFFKKIILLSPKNLIIRPINKNLNPLAKIQLERNIKKSNLKKPLVIVIILKGIGVKPPIITEYTPHLL